ncbi:MAG TPA: ArgE/DapE family deacylase [Thermohalobaculum sp.]|nr:ArgE/DapE family deacylase [Thermohalobaculum sp.]
MNVMPGDLDPALEAQIIAAVDDGFDAQIEFTQALVRHPSLRGREHTAQELVHGALRARGYSVERWAIDVDEIRDHPGFSPVAVDYENAINVVATHRPPQTLGRSLILNGHIDVVPVGPTDMWSRSPFDPHLEGDWLYGRGAGDMKAGLAANIFALDALKSLGWQPAATVYLQSVTEEECTGNGALSCLVRGYRADAAIITEPSNCTLVSANVGVIWFKVTLRGHPVHVREAGAGSNAIEAAYPIIQGLRELEAEMNSEQGNWPPFTEYNHPINLNIGKIAGGDWASSVPAWCEIDCRLAIYPGQDPSEVARRIETAVSAACQDHPYLSNNPATVEWNGFFARGYILEEGTDAEAALVAAHRRATSGGALERHPTTGYLDGRVFVLYDDCPCLVYGPKSENIHGFDERVSLTSTREVTRSLALFTARWCGLTSI